MFDFEMIILYALTTVVLCSLPVLAWWMAPAYGSENVSPMRLLGYTAAAGSLLIVSGVAHALRTDRWFVADELVSAAQKLDAVPNEFGDWKSEEVERDAEMLEAAEARGCYSRRFSNSKTGELLHVLILCGRPGPIAVHTPDVCFVASGQTLVARQSHMIQSDSADRLGEFYVGDFSRTVDGVPYQMRTFWAWSADGDWKIADNTRLEFATYPFLYKMYVSHTVPVRSEFDETDAALEFMKEFLPHVHQTLFPDN